MKDFGDFQTPSDLVFSVLRFLNSTGKVWPRVLEPTCGSGNFIAGLLNQTIPPREVQGIEIQDSHFTTASRLAARSQSARVVIRKASIFNLDLSKDLRWSEQGDLLVVGNPPWVTNAELGVLKSDNLPKKSNIKGLRGLDAITGEANFDIAEYIWLKLIKELAPQRPTIALLCKTSVARNVVKFASRAALPIINASIRRIDARKWFAAAVDACLFCVDIGEGGSHYQVPVYPDLCATEPEAIIAVVDGEMVSDTDAYKRASFVNGVSSVTWRQGLKHDAASVMELVQHSSGNIRNKLDEPVVVESDYLYPLLKSSDLRRKTTLDKKRLVIVTQKRIGEDTNRLRQKAPLLWDYLIKHVGFFEKRKSSIYSKNNPFAIFGIGDYCFAPYKVAIAGLYKVPEFRAIAPIEGRPFMLDDTCYFIACHSPEQAALLTSLLNDPVCIDFIRSLAFSDSKRPITKKLLQRIDLKAALDHVDRELLLRRVDGELRQIGEQKKLSRSLLLESLLIENARNIGNLIKAQGSLNF